MKKYLFISPHLDDAVFSCAQLLLYLSHQPNIELKIITLFTSGSPKPYTKFAREFVENSGFEVQEELFSARKKEDWRAAGQLGAKLYHADFIDASFRKKIKSNFWGKMVENLYPTSDAVFSKVIHPFDMSLISKISTVLIKETKTANVVFCPLAIGNHVDHLITKRVVANCKKPIMYWKDYPYSLYGWAVKDFQTERDKLQLWRKISRDKTETKKLLDTYQSQIGQIQLHLENSVFIEEYFIY